MIEFNRSKNLDDTAFDAFLAGKFLTIREPSSCKKMTIWCTSVSIVIVNWTEMMWMSTWPTSGGGRVGFLTKGLPDEQINR